jgi:hypothetical protein
MQPTQWRMRLCQRIAVPAHLRGPWLCSREVGRFFINQRRILIVSGSTINKMSVAISSFAVRLLTCYEASNWRRWLSNALWVPLALNRSLFHSMVCLGVIWHRGECRPL